MNKVCASVDEAVADIYDNASVAIGGFFTAGGSISLVEALSRHEVKDLTLVVQSVGIGNWEINRLLENHRVRKVICNYPFFRSASRVSLFEQQLRSGEVECEVYPMGTFIEKLRAGGAGIAGFYTPTGAGTSVAEGKESRVFDGKEYLLELALKTDFALIHAYKGDTSGNLIYRKTSRNYNPEMAMAANVTIAEVENLVEPGEINPDYVHTPNIFVQRLVKVDRPQVEVTIEATPAEANS
ncbi:MAG TPA: CoA transferase subunit A [Dehalococcoidia bacterium]|nr:CoA transferase subunit A [Dehalococcoidia bacterium]